jgi:glycosyltransferase involved in cell wall biosynthesis
MIKAAQATLKEKKIQLLILGKGIQKKTLNFEIKKNKLNNNIRLLGEIKNPFPILLQAKIFILTSRREGMPTALLQAIALKKMVISTNCPSGPKEILSKLNCGYLAEVGSISNIKNGILKGLNNKIKKADHDKFLKNYDIGFIIKKYINVFQKN